MSEVTVYGADWCGDTVRTLKHLDKSAVSYKYINIDNDETAEKKVIEFNKGKRRIPMVEVSSEAGDVKTLSVPSDSDLAAALKP